MRLPDWSAGRTAIVRREWNELTPCTSSVEAYSRLADLLSTHEGKRCSPSLIEGLCGSANRDAAYAVFEIPKRRGGRRILAAPKPGLAWVQRSLLLVLTHLFKRHQCAKAFERGLSVKDHARLHRGKRAVFCADLADFFPSIHWGRVFGMFRAPPFGASETIARILANLTTYRGSLPQGAPTSPILANLLCRPLDSDLLRWSVERKMAYSRYADDLAFSTSVTGVREEHFEGALAIIGAHGFRVHPDKTRFLPYQKRQVVTGLIVNRKVNVPKHYVRSLRAIMHNVKRFGWKSQLRRRAFPWGDISVSYGDYTRRNLNRSAFDRVNETQSSERYLITPGACIGVNDVESLKCVLRGRIDFVGQIRGREDRVYLGLKERFQEIMSESGGGETAEEWKRRCDAFESEGFSERDLKTRYNAISELLGKQALSELHRFIESECREFVELLWSIEESAPDHEVKRLAWGTKTHPRLTARFLAQFYKSDEYARFLTHEPQVPDQDGALARRCLRRCRDLLQEWQRWLPNSLKDPISQCFLDPLKEFCDERQVHPWVDSACRNELILPFKRALKLGESPEDETYLHDELRGYADQLQRESQNGCEIKFVKEVNPDARTAVRAFTLGLREILRSMHENTTGQLISVWHKSHDAAQEIHIADHQSRWRARSDEVLAGFSKLRRVVKNLRGIAEWAIVGAFEDGAARIDVMENRVAPARSARGVEHIVTIYR